MMDVTFVLEESGVTATAEVPCEADVAAAKEVACTALAVSPASVEMRIGTQVLEGTCRLQDTAFDAGVQVVLARPRFADIKCPAEHSLLKEDRLSLSRCGTLCVYSQDRSRHVGGFDTETFDTVFSFEADALKVFGAPAISQCKTRCYLACGRHLLKVALPGGEVLRKLDDSSYSVFACGGVVVSKGKDIDVYDEDLTLLRSLSHERCREVAVSDCGGWVITSSDKEKNTRLWDVNTGEAVACVPVERWDGSRYGGVALSRSGSVFAVGTSDKVHLFDWSGVAMSTFAPDTGTYFCGMQFTPCGKYLVMRVVAQSDSIVAGHDHYAYEVHLHQYDVATMSCVHVIPRIYGESFAISPCSRVVVAVESETQRDAVIVTRHLYPHNSE